MTVSRVKVPGGTVHCEVFGPMDHTRAVFGLHGGPGAGASYLTPLAQLADLCPVVLYDQLGCGRSDIPDDNRLWTVARFVDELDAVIDASPFEDAILYGHSWGGWLAIEYVLKHPGKVAGLILASTSASIRAFVDGTERLIDELPQVHRDAIRAHGSAQAYDHPDYQAAIGVFYARHLCRSDPWPPEVLEAVANLETTPVYPVMNGPNEFTVIGSLKGWDRAADLGRITCPTLVCCGEYDEIIPACTHELAELIPDAQACVIPGRSHLALNEAPNEVLPILRNFIAPLV